LTAAEPAAATQRQERDAQERARHEADAAKMNEELTRARADAEEARQQAANAGQMANTLKLKAAPRHLTNAQRQTLIDILKSFAGEKAAMTISMGDSESHAFASEFVSLFRTAGWDAGANDGVNQAVYSGPPTYGIQVTINEQDARAQQGSHWRRTPGSRLDRVGTDEGGFREPTGPAGKDRLSSGPKRTLMRVAAIKPSDCDFQIGPTANTCAVARKRPVPA
jgi:hypothetical protein